MNPTFTIYQGQALETLRALPAESVQTCVTSPPYWGLRDYGVEGQLGLEKTPEAYCEALVSIFREVRRVLRDDGTLWLNLGDSYAGSWGAQSRPNGNDSNLQGGSMLSARQIEAHPRGQTHTGSLKNTPGLKPKDLVGIPWMVAFALRADGWWLRSDIIWSKPNPMPESVTDRPTKAHEYIFLLSKSAKYFYDSAAVAEPAQTWTGQAATFERSGPVSEHVLPNQSAAQHRASRNGKNSLRGQGAERNGANGPANRDGRDMQDVGAGATRNLRSVWNVATKPFSEAHFATFPPELVETCIKAGSAPSDMVLDPFTGSGTTGMVALRLGRNFVGVELNPTYVEMARNRILNDAPLLNRETA